MARTQEQILASLLDLAPGFIARSEFGVVVLTMLARVGAYCEGVWDTVALWRRPSTASGDVLDAHLDSLGLPAREPWETDDDVRARLARGMEGDNPTPQRWQHEFERVIQPSGYSVEVFERELAFFDVDDDEGAFFYDVGYLVGDDDPARLIVVEVPSGIEVVEANSEFFDLDAADDDAFFYDVHYLDPLPEDLEREPYTRIFDFVFSVRPHGTAVRVFVVEDAQPIHLAAAVAAYYRGGPIIAR